MARRRKPTIHYWRDGNPSATAGNMKLLVWFLAIVAALLLIGAINALLNQRPSHIISPLAHAAAPVATPSATLTPTAAPERLVEDEARDFIRRVHMLESSAGRNTNPHALHNYCKSLSRSNEYGYGGMAMMLCFDSHEQATERVTRWYIEHRAQMSEGEAYCYYNVGLVTEDCRYWKEAQEL